MNPDDALLAHVRPPDWSNPSPKPLYDLVVLGAGTAGLVAAAGAAGLGARVALVERHRFGGDCLNTGCVPSKSLLRSAHALARITRSQELGLRLHGPPAAAFTAVMARLRSLRAAIAPHDGVRRFAGLGVDVFLGHGCFTGTDTVEVDGRRLRFKRAVIATGARPSLPDIPGLAEAHPLTSETVFELGSLPARLAVIGGGPIGCELAQAFHRLGARVTLLQRGPRILPRDDPEAAAVVHAALVHDGVGLRTGVGVEHVELQAQERVLRIVTADGTPAKLAADAVLVATGRSPNVQDLGLERIGVAVEPGRGVVVDDFLRTTCPGVFAAGDVCLRHQFTHAADFAARAVIQNALFSVGPFGRVRMSGFNVPWCTYTEPELAHTGITAGDAATAGIEFDTWTQPFAAIDRAITDSETEGFVRIHTRRGSDRILGATVVGHGAGELISEISVAMAGRVGLGRLASVIHPYPTRADAVRRLGDQYRRTRLTPAVASLLRWRLRW